MSQTPTAHALSLQQTLKSVETNITSFGSGPFTPEQAEKLKELIQLKQRLLDQIKASTQNQQTPYQPVAQQAVNNQSPGAVLTNMDSIKTEVQPMIIGQSNVASTAQIHQTPIKDDKILSKKRLQELVKEIDPNEQLDDEVEEMLMQITDDFIESVVGGACDLAKHRNASVLEVKDLKLHLENRWNISVPGYGSDEIKPFKKPITTEAHKQRLSLIRKASKK